MKRLVSLIALMLAFCLLFAGCNNNAFPNDKVTEEHFRNVNMKALYDIYVDYKNDVGETPLEFEE